ncbi:MAG TPA: outer membrane beta-barrel protein [candidate division Zixibacteria bacterium]|nr:outer membrane beta-barrel protein [candidate division Zixibacteria bacterium]MDD4917845.1 outer membrane beta-barrel protein [candidate division Zixibacteria bacterium]MDM7973031.1 outer membrane beta-barrel protein [candidate division Zixibacteria bacterium]HOD67717.1 outer membrane beta-barrel protein [candidate division Zixibacteria bacterium]HOZ07548.1 outer membrane beta-barrel protein [candidate division Zixibacteria bacterium]
MPARRLIGIGACLLVAGAMVAPGAPPAMAQDQNFQAGLHFLAGLPTGQFDDLVGDNAYGIGGHFLWSPPRSPLGLGLSLGFLNFGSESRREPFSRTIPDVRVKVTTSNNMFQGLLFLRTQYRKGDFRPYADALAGFDYFWMETSVKDEDESEDIASSTDHDDAAFTYGVGGGVMIRLHSGQSGGKPFALLLDLGARYLRGGEVEYARHKDIIEEQVTYDIVTTESDLVVIALGVTGTF